MSAEEEARPAPAAARVGTIWDALRGGLATRALALVADLRVADALIDGPRHVDDLARGSGADPDVLHRLLRALASDGIFAEEAPGVFRHTEASSMLTRDGWDDFAHLFGGIWLRAVADLRADGRPSFPRTFGAGFWTWLAEHPRERAAFDRAMAQGWQGRLERLETVEWSGEETVVDVGGGDGSLLRELLALHPGMHGIVFDVPETVRDEAALGERLTFVAGDFFRRVPPGDVHLLSTVLHDWDDASARRILETVRESGAERLVILDAVVAPGNEPHGAKWLDLLMLALAGGRERSEPQWRGLLEASGWEPTRFGAGIVEARPERAPVAPP